MSKRSQYRSSIPAVPSAARKSRKDAFVEQIWQVFSPDGLRRVCTMHERDFAAAYDMTVTKVAQTAPDDFYAFLDRGSNILAVAHLDTVGYHDERQCNFLNTAGGTVVYSRALDDRLGAYTILDLLPRLGIDVDVLLTVGEESGKSTAAFFEPSKQYDWIIEFDRGGTDVVMYQYDDFATAQLVRDSGAKVSEGIFSDICYLEHLGVKAFNWGTGYADYHGPRAHAFLDDTFTMLARFMEFHSVNKDTHLAHVEDKWLTDDADDADLPYEGRDDELRAWWSAQTRLWKDDDSKIG